ncbi:hypothetical protein [Thermococcus sp.]|uniref:hypothetical protein n=1 Tax=Thermococcus sp. TaxID=35749 RepID=UPI0025F66FEB|nr:hypothetical protein [Thermococcus sp.]
MKRLAAFLIFLLAGAIVPAAVMAEGAVATIHVEAGMPETITIPGAIVNWTGEFQYTAGKGWEAYFKVHFTETGNPHDVTATERGFVDSDGKYIWILTDVQVTDNPEEKELTLYGEWNQFLVKEINPLTGEAKIYNARDDKIYTLHKGEEVEIGQFDITERTTLELKDLTWSSVRLMLHHYTVASGTVEVYPNPGYPPGTELEEGMTPTLTTNSTPQPFIDPTKVPAVMIVVGEHAAGADVAAGAKVGIAVQKWIDESDSLIEWLPLPSTVVKAYKELKKSFIRADAMLDTEVTDPNKMAPIVYSVGGPAANEYSAMLNNRTDLPVRFVKENGKWYLVSKYGDKWSGSYGVIEVIPSARTPEEMKEHLLNGDFKLYDVLVAGLDRKGTYAACKLLNANFMDMLNGQKPDPRLMNLITLQAQLNMLFSGYFYLDQANAVAIVVDENGKIVEVVAG